MFQTDSAGTPGEHGRSNAHAGAAQIDPSVDAMCREWGEVIRAILSRRAGEATK